MTVACTREAPLFAREAAAAGTTGPLGFVNLREQAGWSREGASAGPKLAGRRHWMFADPARLALRELCGDRRAAEATLGGTRPYAGAHRPAVRTTEDWLRDAAAGPEA